MIDNMTIIVTVVATVSVMVLGILVGMSVHREATRRRRNHLRREEMELALERGALDGRRRQRVAA